MAEVRQALGVDVVYHLYIEDQGYVDPVHLTRLGKAGIVKGISNNTHLPLGLESLKHVNQQGRRSWT